MNDQSCFKPTFPAFRSPPKPTMVQRSINPNIAQKLARYPAMRACVSFSCDWSVMIVEITCRTAIPRALPNCADVLKTAPARAWVLLGNTLVITISPTVKRALKLTGCSSCATKAFPQYGHEGWITAMSKGEPAQRTELMLTIQTAETRCTTAPITRFRSTPITRLGRIRMDACRAERNWTSWKLKETVSG